MIQPYQYHLLNHRESSQDQDQWEANVLKGFHQEEKKIGLVGNDFINKGRVIMPEK